MSAVTVEKAGSVAVVRMNRPDRMNVFDFDMGRGLLDGIVSLGADPAVRCVVLTGTGKAFSAGGDVSLMGTFTEGAESRFLELTVHLHAFIASLRRCPKPVISAVNGVAAGAGFSFALAGDIAVAARSARFTLAYQSIGLSPDGGASYFLARVLGTQRAMELTLTGRTLSADEAAAWGLVQKVFSDDSFEADVAALAADVAAGPTLAYAKAKELYNRALCQSLETHMEDERQRIAASSATADFRDGVRAFLEKRKPEFRGK